VILLLAASVFDGFDDGPVDPVRWYVGVPDGARKGWLRIPRDGWIVARGIPEERERIEIVFRHKGGALELAFFDGKEPLSSPLGTPLLVTAGPGVRTLALTAAGAELDGAPVAAPGWKGTFRLRALKGDIDMDEVRVAPRVPDPSAPLDPIVLGATTPPFYRDGEVSYSRVTTTLWDVDVALLLARGAPAFRELRAPPKGAPVLAALVTAGPAPELAKRARDHPLARADWRDEARNLPPAAFEGYLESEYGTFAVLMDAQRALNAAAPGRKGLEPLVHLAVIRHAANAHAAVGLAETDGARDALAALRKALGGEAPAQASADRLRAAAGEAARALLGEPPAEWTGFRFDPTRRFVALERAKELAQ
jgi:hypothetical protein